MNVHERAVAVAYEIGSTAGDKHDDIILKALGFERGLEVAIRRGPPPVRRE